jgi:heptosyltransferase III
MGTVLDQLPSGSRVAVIRLRSMGDCVLTTPALEILARSRPDLEIAVVVEPRFAAIFEGNPDVRALLEPVAAAVAEWAPRLCINLHGGTRSLALTVRSGAGLRAGFAHYRYSALYNVAIPTAQEILGVRRKVHTAEHLASAMFHLGAPRSDIPRARLFPQGPAARPAKEYAVLHPMASEPGKTWPADRFLAVAEYFEKRWVIEPVFVAGPEDDVRSFSRYRVIAGAPLAEVKELIRGACAFAGNDSGPAHIAAAYGVPLLVIFGSSDVEVWAPWKAPASEVLHGRPSAAAVTLDAALAALERLRVAA